MAFTIVAIIATCGFKVALLYNIDIIPGILNCMLETLQLYRFSSVLRYAICNQVNYSKGQLV